jgi:hypothetical protein
MRSKVRFALLAPLIGVVFAVAASAAQAGVSIEKLVSTDCNLSHKACAEEMVGENPILKAPLDQPKEPTLAEAEAEGYTQAGGHSFYGVTDFQVATVGDYKKGEAVPTGVVTHVRTDVSKGFAASPAAVPQCTHKEFGEAEAVPGTGFYLESSCKSETLIGEEKATVYVAGVGDVPLAGKTWNLVPPEPPAVARPSEYGTALALPMFLTGGLLKKGFEEAEAKGAKPGVGGFPTIKEQEAAEAQQYYAHTLIEGNVEWGAEAKGTGLADYHDYFEVTVSPNLPLIRSRLETVGTSGNGAFLTNATQCPGDVTTRLSLEGVNIGSPEEVKKSLENPARELAQQPYTAKQTLTGCNLVPFEPTFALNPQTTKQDESDGITAELGLKRPSTKAEIDSAQLENASVTLPAGMTLNPSAAAELAACTPAQAMLGSSVAGMTCPATSALGSVELNTPTLLPGSLTGTVYLGGPEGGGPITGGSNPAAEYTVYVNAESKRYGVDVRLEGKVLANRETGQVTTTFSKNPEQPFTNLTMHFKTGALAPIANPLVCGTAKSTTSLTPYTGTSAQSPFSEFVVDSNGTGGACASPLPFSLSQSTANQTAAPGANTSFTFNLVRPPGQQYLSQVQTTLPEGLVGKIPAAEQCSEAAANSETVACPEGSKLGTAVVLAGAGSTPYAFTGQVYLTGPYNGAPFGMSIKVPTAAGPFNFGTQVTRATLNINQYTGRVIVTSVLPAIRQGVPLRIQRITVAVTKQGFLINPTNCSVLQTESTISGFTPETGATASASLSTPFQVTGCGGLAFKPSFKSKTSAKTSKANGASLETTLNIGAGQTNFKSVMVQLPKQLPSRLTTLQKACPEAVFNSNPFHCPSGSFVGGARANTPTLPGKLQGPAILVSHAGLAFPDLDLVMEANGVKVILVGNTKISKGITTTTFAAPPDVPVSSITVNLPIGAHSAVTANGSLCINPLTMPTTMIGQNGFVIKQNTKITVTSCPVRIAGKKTVGNTAYITVQTYSAGRISGSGSNLKTVYRHLGKAEKTATLKVPLSNGGLRKGKPLRVKVRVGFVPKTKSSTTGNSAATTTVVFG